AWVLFGPDGGFLENVRPDASLGQPGELRMGGDGAAYSVPNDLVTIQDGRLYRRYLVADGRTVEARARIPLIRWDAEQGAPRVVDELWLPPRDVVEGTLQPMAFAPEHHWAPLPGAGVAV